jgi:D-lyxose ketol-isomerase
MKRSEINAALASATSIFQKHGWTLPPEPKWDITDFGLHEFAKYGLVLVNLCEEAEYCEKLMLAWQGQHIFAHTHKSKKEDIISRFGVLAIQVWNNPERTAGERFSLHVNSAPREVASGDIIYVRSGERVTLVQGIYHAFWSVSEYCVIGEVSTANDDVNDNFFLDEVGRFTDVEEDAPPFAKLLFED